MSKGRRGTFCCTPLSPRSTRCLSFPSRCQTLNLDGTWTGADDAQIFSSTGHSTLRDDFPNHRDLAPLQTFTVNDPIVGAINGVGDYDNVRVQLNSSLVYTIHLQADQLMQVDLVDENFTDGIDTVQNAPLSTPSGTFQMDGATEMAFNFLARDFVTTNYELSIVSVEPKAFWTQFDQSTMTLTWTPPVDDDGDPVLVDSYVVAQHEQVEGLFRGRGEFHRTAVAAGASQFTLSELSVLGSNYVRVGRVVNGEVVEWSNAAEYQNNVRPVINPVTGRTITWPDLPGDPARIGYEIAINNLDTGVNNVIRETYNPENSFPLPDDFGIGNFEVFVRGVSFGGQRWGWSHGVRFRSQTAVKLDPITESSNPVLTWTAISGADHYQLYVLNQTTGEVVANYTNVSSTSYAPAAGFGIGEYIAWARAIHSSVSGHPGRLVEFAAIFRPTSANKRHCRRKSVASSI